MLHSHSPALSGVAESDLKFKIPSANSPRSDENERETSGSGDRVRHVATGPLRDRLDDI